MDSKYGRLFTEGDVDMLVAAMGFADMPEHVVPLRRRAERRLAEEGFELRFPTDEPLFLLRGQDKAATEAIGNVIETPESSRSYLQACRAVGAHNDHLAAVNSASAEFETWQQQNPDRVKVPDS